MDLLSRLRDALGAPAAPERDPQADLRTVRRALEAEATRLGRRERLSLSLLLEYSPEDLTLIDVHGALGHLHETGEIRDVQEDSFGNLRFALGDRSSIEHDPDGPLY